MRIRTEIRSLIHEKQSKTNRRSPNLLKSHERVLTCEISRKRFLCFSHGARLWNDWRFCKEKKYFNKYSFAPLIVYGGIGPEKRYHGNLKQYLLIDNWFGLLIRRLQNCMLITLFAMQKYELSKLILIRNFTHRCSERQVGEKVTRWLQMKEAGKKFFYFACQYLW